MRAIREGYLYQLTSLARLFPVNCYLIEEEEGLTLIDAAMPFSAKGILEVAKKIGKPITRIVLTHAHEDHVGALDAVKAEFAAAPVYISKRDARIMDGDKSLEGGEPQTVIKGGVPKNLKTKPDILLNEGDRVGSLIAIETPGHTPGSMSFMDIRSNALIAGDAFQIRGGMAVAGDKRIWFPFPALGTWDKKTALKSAKKILSYQPSILAVGHGEMIKNPQSEMEKVIKRFEMKL
ncbi:MBL fold metallo-hydrolase [Neobacillus terrae]|uniref:MBL fold metallo-hydrolase n=1 Tax=Neobacillus terrae TaxID=3034837 RepID=UPI00140A66C2|nr:MBL fold metallo-hydrolase [Neobacillus terrae]NHM31599.1 MBL fold metallo-hydrolase [Neobacillus terrae]